MRLLLLMLCCTIALSTQAKDKVTFMLHNTTKQSIPLIIPNVMNPNLSPFSKSGVTLNVGQTILFKYKGKRQLLLTVSGNEKDKTFDVAQLIKERKKELDALSKRKK